NKGSAVGKQKNSWGSESRRISFTLSVLVAATIADGQPPKASPAKISRAKPEKPLARQDDSVSSKPPLDLALRSHHAHKADALARFVEGMAFEENGEMDRALEADRKVLNGDPGQAGV